MSNPKHQTHTSVPSSVDPPTFKDVSYVVGGILIIVLIICFAIWKFCQLVGDIFSDLGDARSNRRQAREALAAEAAKREAVNKACEEYKNDPLILRTGQNEKWRDYKEALKVVMPQENILGGAREAAISEIAKAGGLADDGIPLGIAWNHAADNNYKHAAMIRYNGQPHIITVAPAGSGKFRDELARRRRCSTILRTA